ncbi:MAG: saccharopine dehydrogenase NADP-binding domain-containing protein [Candidatus Hydrogenedentes bacterium]|nr:saccharopine dehydrogenase NADP-binding domain-containing protein [Candidatus Hydrogenedentota bacterium]
MVKEKILIYGAYGYTGRLIVEEAIFRGLPIIVAGRNKEKIVELSKEKNVDYRIFSLNNKDEIANNLESVKVVIHSAGPFIHTAKPMIEACLISGTHYIDITGEIDVFEWIATCDSLAKTKGIMLLPGAGFDVVPTDCLALHLKELLPDATHLTLAFYSNGKPSHGTMITALESLGKGGKIRVGGEIQTVPPAYKKMKIDFGEGPKLAVTIPWGDVSTAYYSTGIPNIEVFMAITPGMNFMLKGIKFAQKIIGQESVQNFIKNRIPDGGPMPEERKNNYAIIWGKVQNLEGEEKQAVMRTPDGYDLTAKLSVLIAQKVLKDKFRTGFQTPAKAYGSNLILEIPGIEIVDL